MANSKPDRTPRKGRAIAYEPRQGDISKNTRRAYFLDTVKKLEPGVLEELSREPLDLFRRVNLTEPRLDAITLYNVWARLNSERWGQIRDANLIWFRRKLWEWGERWGLTEEWCLRAAFETVTDWAFDEELASERSWSMMIYAGGYVAGQIPNEREFSFDNLGWQITRFPTRQAYEKFIRAEFEDALKDYCDKIEQAAPEYGYVEVPQLKYNRKPHLPFEWLVRNRVQGWTLYRINKEYYPNSKTDNRSRIKKAIEEVAGLIGLPLDDLSPD